MNKETMLKQLLIRRKNYIKQYRALDTTICINSITHNDEYIKELEKQKEIIHITLQTVRKNIKELKIVLGNKKYYTIKNSIK